MAFFVLLRSSVVSAHHPGIIGPVSHLGADTVIRVILAALLDGVNPTALGVLLFLCYRAKKRNYSAKRHVFLFLAGMLVTYVAAGVILRATYASFGPTLPVQIFQIIVAGLLFLSGLQELQKALSHDQQPQVSEVPSYVDGLLRRFDAAMEKGFSVVLGVVIGAVELFATGAIYLSFIQAVSYDRTAPWWVTVTMMAIYLVAFLVPIITAYSYRDALVGEMSAETMQRARRARAVTGSVFMLAAVFIAASAVVTIRAIEF